MIVAVSTNKKKIDLVVSPLNDNGLIDTDTPVTYWSSRPGHARPAIKYFKVAFFVTLRIWIGHVLSWLLYVMYLVVGLSFNPFEQTTGNNVNINIKLYS